MKYCVEYSKDFRYIDEIDELSIKYKKNDSALENFLKAFKDKRIIIEIAEEDVPNFIDSNIELDFIQAVAEKYEVTICFKLPDFLLDDSTKLYEKLQERKIPAFFNTLVHSWDILEGLRTMGVSDMYIVEELGFEIHMVAKVLHAQGINVRCFPNVAQSAHFNIEPIKKFFIRPEDVGTYNPFIDVFEFYGNDNNLYYKIYVKDKKWFGTLDEIILDFDEPLDSRCVIPEFAWVRTHCGKKCFKGQNCRICTKVQTLAETLEDNGLYIKVKDKPFDNK